MIDVTLTLRAEPAIQVTYFGALDVDESSDDLIGVGVQGVTTTTTTFENGQKVVTRERRRVQISFRQDAWTLNRHWA